MAILSDKDLEDMVAEINQDNEKDRRYRHLQRHETYQDGGLRFLINELDKEFDEIVAASVIWNCR